jgi:hypothetical protein
MDTVSEWLAFEVWWARRAALAAWRRTRISERGEGVISAAIAVLVMAFLGAAMWFAFNGTMHTAQSKVDTNVNSIGSGAAVGGSGSGGGTGGPGAGGSGLP